MKAQVDVFGGSTGLVDYITVESTTSSAIVAGVAAGVPLAVILIAAAVILAIFLVRRRRQQRLKSMFQKKATATNDKSYSEMSTMHSNSAREVLQEWLVPLEEIEFGKQVGEGSFGKGTKS